MWKLSPADLVRLKGMGDRFADFLDRLIRAEAARGGLAQSEIRTQLRVHVRDGGVDTQVQQPIPRDKTGWFTVPTCWQFKAVESKSVTKNALHDEIRKPYADQLIRNGYAYRLCLLGDLTPQKVEKREAELIEEVRAMAPQSPQPKVIHGGDLLNWAEQFPAIIAWLRELSAGVFHLESWAENCRRWTPKYVPNVEWETVCEQIRRHADFDEECLGGEPCLTIGGAAGVGKTRLVFETLAALPASPGLVVYAADEQEAKKMATAVVNTSGQTALLVADECTPQTRHFLNENVRGHAHRLRIFCLDNTGERLASLTTQIWLSPEALKNTDAILEANFSSVPSDRRWQYAQLSRGFVRLAADMCLHDHELMSGDLSGLLGSVERYVRLRVPREHLPLISLLALFHKVGFRESMQGTWRALAS